MSSLLEARDRIRVFGVCGGPVDEEMLGPRPLKKDDARRCVWHGG